MDSEKFAVFVQLFTSLYNEGKIIIKWRKNATVFRSTIDLERELNKFSNEFTEEEFVSAVFNIIKIARSICIGEDLSKFNQDHVNLINESLLANKELFLFINIQSSSKSYLMEDLEFDLNTIRRKDNFRVIGYSALASYYLNDSQDDEQCTPKRITIELTKKEIDNMIQALQKIRDNMDNVESNGLGNEIVG